MGKGVEYGNVERSLLPNEIESTSEMLLSIIGFVSRAEGCQIPLMSINEVTR
jgi:hypothetical protein